jgi:hypothetical protein
MTLSCVCVFPAVAATQLQPDREALETYEEARQALAAGRWNQAELLLERVLMLMPEHAEARLDFALALARRGQTEASRSIIMGLAQDPRTSAEHVKRLREMAEWLESGLVPRLGALDDPAPSSARPRAVAELRPAATAFRRVELALAHSTNPLARTGAEGIVITPPEGPVTLPLDNRPQAGAAVGVTLLAVKSTQGLELSLQRLDQTGTATAYKAMGWGEWPAWATRLGLPDFQWQWQTVKSFDAQRRHFAAVMASLPQVGLSGNQRFVLGAYSEPTQGDRGLVIRLEHRDGKALGQDVVTWQAGAERSASSARTQGYWRAHLNVEVPLLTDLRAQAQITAQKDVHPYSPLLANNSVRWLATAYAGIDKKIQLDAHNALHLRAFASQRTSNLTLFKFRDQGLQIAMRASW